MPAIDHKNLRLERLGPEDSGRLQEFLESHPERAVFHAPQWHQFVEDVYGHRCLYWAATVERRILGILPVTVVRHPLAGTKMVALAYQMHSGMPLGTGEEIQEFLIDAALSAARRKQARYLEIRTRGKIEALDRLGFVSPDPELVVTTTPLAGLRLSQIRRGHRGEVRYASRRGVTVAESNSMDDLRQFYRLYLHESRALGVPRPGWSFYRALKENLGESCRLLTATAESGEMLGALLLLDDGINVFARDGAYSSPAALRLKIGKALFWRALEDAAGRGNQSFHFGISWVRNEGLIKWKEGWNGTTRPIYQYSYSFGSRSPTSDSYFSGFRLAKAIWRRLPMPVAERLGHQVTRWIC